MHGPRKNIPLKKSKTIENKKDIKLKKIKINQRKEERQMKKRKTENQKGITLVALVITIILLIILASIVIRSIAGNDGLIGTTLTAKESYTIATYQEAIEGVVQKTILANKIAGKETTRKEIAEAIQAEVDGVIKAIPNEETKDVVVITKEGYIFQIYYDNIYGTIETEYTGKLPEGENPDKIAIPELTGEYISSTGTIKAEASIKEGTITKIELIYKGNIVEIGGKPAVIEINNSKGAAEFNIAELGKEEGEKENLYR